MASHASVFPASLARSADRKSAGVAAGWEQSQPVGVMRDSRKAPQPSALRKLHAQRDTISTVGAGNRESFLSNFSLGGAGSNENVVSVRLPAPRGLRNTTASIASSGIWSSVEPSPEDASSAEEWRKDNLSEMERWEYEQRFGVYSSELEPHYVADPRTAFRMGGPSEAAASRQLGVLDAELGQNQLEQSARLQYMQMQQEHHVQTQEQMQGQMQMQAQAQHMHMMQTQQMPVVVQRILISPHPAGRRRTAGFGCTIA
jgi:hypothetical protein